MWTATIAIIAAGSSLKRAATPIETLLPKGVQAAASGVGWATGVSITDVVREGWGGWGGRSRTRIWGVIAILNRIRWFNGYST